MRRSLLKTSTRSACASQGAMAGGHRRNAAMIASKLMARTIAPMSPRTQGGVMRRPVCFLLAAILLWPLAGFGQVQPHRAEYALRLGAAANAPRVGTAVQDLSQDCGGWKLKRDISTEIAITPSWKMSLESKLDGEELRSGSAF